MDNEKDSGCSDREERADIDFSLGLGGILKGLGNFIDMLGEMERKGETRREGQGEANIAGGKGKAMYGFSVRLGEIDKRLGKLNKKIEEFGNIHQTEEGPVVDDVREPMVDVFNEEDKLEIVAEIPGVEEDDITIETQKRILILGAIHGDRKYKKEIKLPPGVQEAFSSIYRNGILTITLPKKGQSEDE